jgi:hypothetical protein
MKTMKKLFAMAALCAVVITTSCNKNEDLEALAGLVLSSSKNMIKPMETIELSVQFFPANPQDKNLIWTSSNKDVADVDNNGRVSANGTEGFATIRATSASNSAIYAEFTVAVSSTDVIIMNGDVEGTWAKGTTVFINNQIRVPEGKKLFIEEGVTIIVQDGPVGTPSAHIEFFVDGSLYLQGTATNPILVTVPETMRIPEANKYVGLWGGFVGSDKFEEMLFEHVTIEYTGAVTTAASQSAAANIIEKVGNRTAAILTDNPKGRVVVMHSTIRYAESDAMYFMGCEAIVAHNIIHTVGETDNDGINTKAGVKIDIAFNLMFGVNSNGLKLNSKGQSETRQQSVKCVYNNTIVNSGWRRTKNLKGGSIFIQQNASAYVFNNLILNSKLVTKTPDLNIPSPDDGACHSTFVGYNFYASGSQTWTGANPAGTPNIPTAWYGYTQYTDEDIWHDWDNYPADFPKIDQTSLFATSADAPDPSFVNFGFNTVPLGEDMFNPAWDFHVTSAASPIIAGANGKTPRSQFTERFVPFFSASGLMINGVEYKSPMPRVQYGAHGVK